MPRIKKFLSERGAVVPRSVWLFDEAGHNQESRAESLALFGTNPFSTPKPERLLKRVLECATNPGDLVLDSFAGSGTTGAVAHKMGRRWIMVEMGEHCQTHIVPRLKKVIDGQDPGGISEAVSWRGGGGFRYYRLAPSLLERDRWDNWIISGEYNAALLAEAVCKIEGFSYEPSAEQFWLHGRSSERDFIYVSTQELTASQLDTIGNEVGPERTLLICCGSWPGSPDRWPNLTLKKIPNAVLARCEFGRDDYSLQIRSLPTTAPAAEAATASNPDLPALPAPRGRVRRAARPAADEPNMFDE